MSTGSSPMSCSNRFAQIIALGGAVVVASISVSAKPAQAQTAQTKEAFVVNPAAAKAGGAIWNSRQCVACHTIGQGKLVGPDLAGVLQRRPLEWLKRFLRDPTTMLQKDETAKALLKEYNNMPMPNLNLTDAEIESVLHYLAEQSSKHGKK